MSINIVLFTLSGLFILLLGANYLIENIVLLAKKTNISQFIITSCTVALGTTIPELTTSLKSILSTPPHPGIAVGNLIGSNIANILLIIGTAAIIYPIKINVEKWVNLEIKINFIIILFPASIILLNLTQNISFYLSILILISFFYFIFERIKSDKDNVNKKQNVDQSTFLIVSKVIISFVALVVGSYYLIDGSIQIAQHFKVSERVIGLSLVAIGTSLPELITAILASIKKIHGIALGNVLGANAYNILGILSLVEIIEPSSILENTKKIDIYFLIISTILLSLFIIKAKKISRLNALLFLFIYILYIYLIY